MRDIKPLVAPRSIAVIGASANPTKSGGVLFNNLIKGDFKGPLYPINRSAPEVMGKKAYPVLADVPEKVDLVYIVLPREHVEGSVSNASRRARARPASSRPASRRRVPKGRAEEERLREIAQSPDCCSPDPTPSAWSMPRSA